MLGSCSLAALILALLVLWWRRRKYLLGMERFTNVEDAFAEARPNEGAFYKQVAVTSLTTAAV